MLQQFYVEHTWLIVLLRHGTIRGVSQETIEREHCADEHEKTVYRDVRPCGGGNVMRLPGIGGEGVVRVETRTLSDALSLHRIGRVDVPDIPRRHDDDARLRELQRGGTRQARSSAHARREPTCG